MKTRRMKMGALAQDERGGLAGQPRRSGRASGLEVRYEHAAVLDAGGFARDREVLFRGVESHDVL